MNPKSHFFIVIFIALVVVACSSTANITPTSATTITPMATRTSIPKTPTILSTHTPLPTSTTVIEGQMDENYKIAEEKFNEYFMNLLENEEFGGELYCEDLLRESDEPYEEYTSCETFDDLKVRGCFSYTTYDMYQELNYTGVCKEIEVLEQASISTINYFNLESLDWWKTLPADVLPMCGGIYEQETWDQQKIELEEFVAGKLLGDIEFEVVSVEPRRIETILSSEEDECGVITDNYNLEAVLLADFDGDGIAELLLHGYRAYQSETCWLGTGNELGAWFSIIINKDSPSEVPTIADQLR